MRHATRFILLGSLPREASAAEATLKTDKTFSDVLREARGERRLNIASPLRLERESPQRCPRQGKMPSKGSRVVEFPEPRAVSSCVAALPLRMSRADGRTSQKAISRMEDATGLE